MTPPDTALAQAPAAPLAGRHQKRGSRLKSLENVRAYVARVCREPEAEDQAVLKPAERIALQRGGVYGAQVVAEIVKASGLETRLEELERLAIHRE